jgi:hypothetical protein
MALKHIILINFLFFQFFVGDNVIYAKNVRINKMNKNTHYQIHESNFKYDISLAMAINIAEEINAMSRIIAQKSTFENEKDILGKLDYIYPKDPREDITYITFSITGKHAGAFEIHAGAFERIDSKHPWNKCGIRITDDQRPYKMGLSKLFFSEALGLVFEKSIFDETDGKPLPAYNLFYYYKKIGNHKLQYVFESRPDASNLHDEYPKGFHEVNIYDISLQK